MMQGVVRTNDLDCVDRWMQDIRTMTESECMCVLQAKTFKCSAADMAKVIPWKYTSMVTLRTKEDIINLRKRVWEISCDFACFYNKLDSVSWSNVHPLTIRLTDQIEKLIRDFLGDPVKTIQVNILEQEDVRRNSAMLLSHMKRFNNNEVGLFATTSGVVPLLKTLSKLGHSFAALAEKIQCNLIRSLVESIRESATVHHLHIAIECLQSLADDYKELIKVIVKEDGVQVLCQICSLNSVDSLKVDALKTIQVLCRLYEAQEEFEKAKGIPILTDLLSSESSLEVKTEVARFLTQITSPNVDSIQHLLGFTENLDVLLRELTNLCQLAPSSTVFMVATAAIANITIMDNMACDYLAMYNTAEVLLHGCKSGKANDLSCKDEVATTLAIMAYSEQCRHQVIEADGIRVLVDYLVSTLALRSINDLKRMDQLCARVQQKAAIALGRLAQCKSTAMLIIDMKGVERLVALCYNSLERNSSDAVLVASLVTLRRIFTQTSSSRFDATVVEQLIKPSITDSFLFCSEIQESVV